MRSHQISSQPHAHHVAVQATPAEAQQRSESLVQTVPCFDRLHRRTALVHGVPKTLLLGCDLVLTPIQPLPKFGVRFVSHSAADLEEGRGLCVLCFYTFLRHGQQVEDVFVDFEAQFRWKFEERKGPAGRVVLCRES